MTPSGFSGNIASGSGYKGGNLHFNMENAERVEFEDSKVRNEFFESLKKYSNADTWNELYKKCNVPRSMLQSYRYGKLTIPRGLFYSFLENLQKNEQSYFLSKIRKKPANWGAKLGGEITYSKYPEIFEKGRKIASERNQLKYNFDLNMPLSKNLCEFIGAFIGDGFTNNYGKVHITEITGSFSADKDYFLNYLPSLAEKVFLGINPRRYVVKEQNAIRLRFYSKELSNFLTGRFKLPKGKKSHSVRIPDEIINSSDENIFATLRGIFDTDGGIILDKRKIYLTPYPRISLTTASKPLFLQLNNLLEKYFSIYAADKSKQDLSKYEITIYGHKQVERWLKLIGFSNKKHLRRLES